MILRGETLGQVLSTANKLPTDASLFLPIGDKWTLETKCIIADGDLEDAEALVKEMDPAYGYALLISQVQDIAANARLQRSDVSDVHLLQAFLFYYDRDAFIDFLRNDTDSGLIR